MGLIGGLQTAYYNPEGFGHGSINLLTWGFLHQAGTQYSAAEKTRVNLEICNVLAKVPQGYTSEVSDE